MQLSYFGHSCFLLDNGVGRLVFDPFQDIGYSMPECRASIAVISHDHFDHNNLSAVTGLQKTVTVQNLSFSDFTVTSVKTYHDPFRGSLRGANYVHTVKSQGLTFCHLGDYGESEVSPALEGCKGADFLFLPVGGRYTVDAYGAKKIADWLKPVFIVPMHYKTHDSNIDIEYPEKFTALFGAHDVYSVPCGTLELPPAADKKILLFDRRKYDA